jgi:flagellar biosynthetic protein FliR
VDGFFDRILVDPLAQLTLRRLIEAALENFYAFTLVLVRMAGLMTIGPVFGQPVVPGNIRIFLVLSMSLMMMPLLHEQSRIGFRRLDANQDSRLTRDELPEQLHARFDRRLAQTGHLTGDSLTETEFATPARIPSSIIDYARIAVAEFALGLVLGVGVLTILTGLQLAGELIDQQTGIALGEVASPGLDISGSLTGQFFFLTGVTILLLLEPIGGHLMMVSALVETFQTLPIGEATISIPAIELLTSLVHQSLVLGIQVAAPLLATMSLVALTMGFLGHTVPQINVLVIGFPIRASVSLMVLAVSMSGVGRAVVDVLPGVIDNLRHAITFL